jgi:hypothetical protein
VEPAEVDEEYDAEKHALEYLDKYPRDINWLTEEVYDKFVEGVERIA